MKLSRLRCLNMESPMGIDVVPYFSWQMRSEKENTSQIGYQLIVSSGEDLIWDSRRMECAQDAYVLYSGPALRSRTVYRWEVTVWDNHGETDTASACFETGLLDRSEWIAKWVETPFPVKKRSKKWGGQTPAVLFQKSFSLQEKPVSARLYATCHGIYHAKLNGTCIDTGAFAPEFTAYKDCLMAQTYDVTDELHTGENLLSLYVGDGWMLGANTQQPNFKQTRHAVLFQLSLRYADGREEWVCSDERVLATDEGPVRFSDLFQGECYDARRQNAKVKTPAVVKSYPMDNLCMQLGEGVCVLRRFPVQKLIHAPNGDWILDFGQNMAGRVRMRVHQSTGTEIKLEHCEVLDKEGNYISKVGVGTPVLQTDVVICDGSEFVYEPLFTFHGFRYIRVSGIGKPDPADFEAAALSTKKEQLGSFRCSDERLNRLIENTRWSQYSNMLSIPTDCPQREKAGWTGDVGVYATAAQLNEDVTLLFTRWLKSVSLQQDRHGQIPFVVPRTMTYRTAERLLCTLGGHPTDISSAGWGDACVLTPWAMYQITGNQVILKEQYHTMKRWVDSILERAEKRHPRGCKRPKEQERLLWDTGFHYGEWLIPSQSTDSSVWKLVKACKDSASYVAPIYGWISTDLLAKTAEVLGKPADAAFYREKADAIKKAIMTSLLDDKGDPPVDLMGAYAMFLYYDLVPEKYLPAFREKLCTCIEKNGFHLDTGFLTTPILLDTLCQIGRRDLAYRLLYQEGCPSWLFEVKMGATTMWETWYAYNENGEPADLSFNHYAFGCVSDWIYRTIGGIRTYAPGFSEILIQPEPDESLTWGERSYCCPHGEIRCRWEKSGERFTLTAVIPCNTRAAIILPDGSHREVGSGSYSFSCSLS